MAVDVEVRGRALPGRTSLKERPLALVLETALIAALAVATRLPFRTRYLMNWDAAQFALGLNQFDVVHHQPHPPGYIGYLALGRLFEVFIPDPNAALVVLSIAGESLAVVIGFLFASSLFGRFAGWVTALAMVSSPLFWYYGEVANNYALEPVLTLAIAWLTWRLWTGDERYADRAAIAIGLAGALRPSTALMMLPLFLLALPRACSRPAAVRALALLVVAAAAWVIPLCLAAGGPLRLASASFQLGGSDTSGTAIWSAGFNGLLTTANAVLTGIGWELGLFAVLALFGLAVAPRLLRTELPVKSWGLFCWAWAAPSLLVYLFVHIGQVVYVQTFIPAIFLSLGPAVAATALAVGRPGLAPVLAAVCLAANLALFFSPDHSGLAQQLRLHDLRVESLRSTVTGLGPPERTVLLSDAWATGSYRSTQVYLPAYHRVAVEHDLRGRLGEIYGDTYEPWRFAQARQPEYPATATTYVFLDQDLIGFVGDRQHLRRLVLADGSRIWVWQGAEPTLFANRFWLEPPSGKLTPPRAS